jgi:uncharacterized protein YlxW (UPF0749 family)
MKIKDWIILGVLVALFAYVVFKPTGPTEKEIEYAIQVHDLERELIETQKKNEELENTIYDLNEQLIDDSTYVASTSRPEVDSLFTEYFRVRHDEVLHLRRSQVNSD